jgi:hypothetical protein
MFHAIISGPGSAKIRPAATGITRREPPVFYKNMIRIKFTALRDDPIDIVLFSVNDNSKTGLFDHYSLRDLVRT